MRDLIIFLFTISTQAFSQSQLDFGKVKADAHFSCAEKSFLDSFDSLNIICNSKNQFEIRLKISYNPSLEYALIVLTYDGSNWVATKYQATYMSKIISYKLMPKFSFDSIFLELKRNNIFLLPNQSQVSRKIEIFDGVSYILTFKAGDKFRKYDFDNPDIYSEHNKKIKAYKNYNQIATIMNTWFSKE